MKAAAAPYLKALSGASHAGQFFEPSGARIFSTVQGKELTDLSKLSTDEYWVDNLLSPVLFTQAFTHLMTDSEPDAVLELGPHSQMGGPVKQILQETQLQTTYQSCLERGKVEQVTLLKALSRLCIQGLRVPLHQLNDYDAVASPQLLADLPSYSFDRDRAFWHESRISRSYTHRRYLPHELLGTMSPDANPIEPRWRQFLSLKQCPWLRNHVVQGQIVFPATGYLTMAMQAIHQHVQAKSTSVHIEHIVLRNVSFSRALLLDEEAPDQEICLSLRPQARSALDSSPIWNEFRIFSISPDGKWTEHCRGLIQAVLGTGTMNRPGPRVRNVGEAAARCSHETTPTKFYHIACQLGLDWKKPFDNISAIKTGPGTSVVIGTAVSTSALGGTGDVLHPATLDSILFQGLFAALVLEDNLSSAVVPTFIKEMRIAKTMPAAPGEKLVSTTIASAESPNMFDVVVERDCDKDHPTRVVEAQGVTVTSLPADSSRQLDDLCYKIDWMPYLDTWTPQQQEQQRDLLDNQVSASSCTESKDLCIQQISSYCHGLGRLTPRLKALVVGPDASAIVEPVLNALNGREGRNLDRLDVSGPSPQQFEGLIDGIDSLAEGVLELRLLDLTRDVLGQGFKLCDYDFIIATHLTHADEHIDMVLSSLNSMLKPGAKLIILAIPSEPHDYALFVHSGRECNRKMLAKPSRISSQSKWTHKMQVAGFDNLDFFFEKQMENTSFMRSVHVAARPRETVRTDTKSVHFITTDCSISESTAVERRLDPVKKAFPEAQVSVYCLPTASPGNGVAVILPDVAATLCYKVSEPYWQSFKTWLLKSRLVFFISQDTKDPRDAACRGLWAGLARSLRHEHPHIRFITMHLEAGETFGRFANHVSALLHRSSTFDLSVPNSEIENEFAEQNGELYVSRIIACKTTSDYIRSMYQLSPPAQAPFLDGSGRTLTAQLGVPGLLESIRWVDDVHAPELGADDVRLELRAASVNFKDVLIAAGQLPGISSMRNDCSGIVVAVGANMQQRFRPGDKVVAMYSRSYTNYPVVHGDCCQLIPENLTLEQAAGVPVVWATVYHSLVDVGRLGKGDKILIHSAAGAVGQAAIMLAQHIGAEVFATVGSQGKEDLLRENFSIPKDHIFSNRTTAFFNGVLETTKGYGVDVVLNSLSGEIFRQSCNLVAPFGRFVEIGRKDLMDDSLMPMSFLLKNVSFTYVDLALIMDDNKSLARRVMDKVMALLAKGSIKPVSLTTMPISDIESAFRTIQAGKHTGKIVLTVEDKQQVKVSQHLHPNEA